MYTINFLDSTTRKWIQLGKIYFSYDLADEQLARVSKFFPRAKLEIFELY